MRLHLGCGNVILPGFVNVDALGVPGVDVVDDVRRLTAFPHACADLIYASHVLDHVSRTEVADVLAEWTARLRPGGTLRIAVSDFGAVAAEYARGTPLVRLLGHVVGGHKSAYDRHGVVFDESLLRSALAKAGLVSIRHWNWQEVDHGVFDDLSQAYEPHMQKETGRLMSLNIEADRPSTSARSVRAWAIGDSHSLVFSGARVHPKHVEPSHYVYDRNGNFGVIHLGPYLAWRMGDADRQDEVCARIERLFEHTPPRPLIFTLGEIDCRTRPADAKATARRYVDGLVEVGRRLHVPIAAWNPPLPTGGPVYNPEFPARGTYTERRAAAAEFSAVLRVDCATNGLGFLSIAERLADGQARTKLGCYADMIHLDPDVVYGDVLAEANQWLRSL